MSKINSLLMPFEIGDLFFTTNNTNPSNRFGGTWELYAKGKTIVGIDPDDTDFNSINKTGGSKYIQAHSHQKTMYFGTANGGYGYTDVIPYSASRTDASRTIGAGDVSGVPTGNSGNLQPYIVSYIWIKTA